MNAKRFLSLFLLFTLFIQFVPAVDQGAQNIVVNIYTTADDLTFYNPDLSEANVSFAKAQDEYNLYSLTAEPGKLYTYKSEKYGTGILRAQSDADVYLRVVNFTFAQAVSGGTEYVMRVSNSTDRDLIYTSKLVPKGDTTAEVLVPALGWSTEYRYDFVPSDEAFCAFHGPLWVTRGQNALEGFLGKSFNLSDSGSYIMSPKITITINVPQNFTLHVYSLVRFYRDPLEYEAVKTGTSGGYDSYRVHIPATNGGFCYYTVSGSGYTTVAQKLTATDGASITVSRNVLTQTPHRQGSSTDVNASSILTGGNRSKFIPLEVGSEFVIWSSRAWQAVDGITTNNYVEPDKHYILLEGDGVVQVSPDGTVTAKQPGVAVVAVTYDALQYLTNFYPAIDSECVGVFVFAVGKSSEGITTGLVNSTDLDTYYALKSLNIDGQQPTVYDSPSCNMNFTPTDALGQEISVRLRTVYGYPDPMLSPWREYTKNPDGSFDVQLLPGRNIVEITAGDRVAYQVLNCKSTNAYVVNLSSPGSEIGVNDKVQVRFDNIDLPLPKLGAIYNPGYPDTVYLTGTLHVPGKARTEALEGVHTQYSIRTAARFENINLPTDGKYFLDGIRIHTGSMGSPAGAHFSLGRQSEAGNYSGGDSPARTDSYSYLPDIEFTVSQIDYSQRAKELEALIDAIGQVTDTPECRSAIEAARSAYDNAAQATLDKLPEQYIDKLLQAEKAYYGFAEQDVERTIPIENGYYVLSDAKQLEWFASLVNGTLYSKNLIPVPDANAKLNADIRLNENLLDSNYELLDPSGAHRWVSIGSFETPYSGIFDGCGHTVSGLYQTGEAFGMFTANSGTICRLNLTDSSFMCNVKNDSSSVGGSIVAGVVCTNSGKISDVSFDGYVSSEYGNVNDRAAGIAYESDGIVTGCKVSGIIRSDGNAGGVCAYGSGGTFVRCVNNAQISASGYAGGICAYSADIVYDCYSTAQSSVSSLGSGNAAAGILYLSANGFGHCYSAAQVSGSKAYAVCSANSFSDFYGMSYYVDKDSSGEGVAGVSEALDVSDFQNGRAAYLLGYGFGQNLTFLPRDEYPVFNDKKNTVYLTDDGYTNSTVEIAQRLIDLLGDEKVSFDSEDLQCIYKYEAAKNAYDALSVQDRQLVEGAQRLQQAGITYDADMQRLALALDKLQNITKSSSDDIKSAADLLTAYISHGGDRQRFDTALVSDAWEQYRLATQQDIGKTIKTEDVFGRKYYLIETQDQLYWFADLVSGRLADTPAQPNADAMLACDITVNESLTQKVLPKLTETGVIFDRDIVKLQRPWEIIGSSSISYTGIFDGRGHTISGLYADTRYGGLFYELSGATVKNLTLDDCIFTTSSDRQSGLAYNIKNGSLVDKFAFKDGYICGGVSGGNGAFGICYTLEDNSTVQNSYVRATLRVNTNKNNLGSFAGLVNRVTKNSSLKNCYAVVDFPTVYTRKEVAGLVLSASDSSCTFENCYYTALAGNTYDLNKKGLARASAEDFKNGKVAYNLGDAYGQKIGTDDYPEFYNGQNALFKNDQDYTCFSSTELVIDLIDAIGSVGLDGSPDCFGAVDRALRAYNALPEDELNGFDPEKYALLEMAKEKYYSIANEIELKIAQLDRTDSLEQYDFVAAELESYVSHGGSLERIANYLDLPGKKIDILSYPDTLVEKTIETRIIDGANYYALTNAEQLEWFAKLINGDLYDRPANANANAILENDIVFCDIDPEKCVTDQYTLNAEAVKYLTAFSQISGAFSGVFDGDNHTLRGIYTTNGALFDNLAKDAVVKNLRFENALITSDGSSYTGGIANRLQVGAAIQNCRFSGVVLSTGSAKTGGTVGYSLGSIIDVNFDGKIISYGAYVGGIAGQSGETVSWMPKSNQGDIIRCGVTAQIICNSPAVSAYAGGVAGYANGNINDCYMRGSLAFPGAASALKYIGGVAANLAKGKIKNCYAAADFSCEYGFGGLCGAVVGNNAGTVENCYYLQSDNLPFKGINDVDVADKAEARSAERFADGEVAILLGDAFYQDGEYPRLLDNSTYRLTVINGHDVKGIGRYKAGTEVEIAADAPGSGRSFAGWTADAEGVMFLNSSDRQTRVIMPASNLTVTANYTSSATPSEYKGYVTVSFEDNAKRVPGEEDVKYQDALGIIVKRTRVGFYTGDTLADVTLRLLDSLDMSYETDGSADRNFYLISIGNFTVDGNYIDSLGEFDCGSGSGWMVSRNGKFIDVSASDVKVKNGDVIKWMYTCRLGEDIDGSDVVSGSSSGKKDDAKTPDGLSPALTADSNGSAKWDVDVEALEKSLKQDGKKVVLSPQIKGKLNKITIEIPVKSLKKADLSGTYVYILTPIADVYMHGEELQELYGNAESIAFTFENLQNNAVKIDVSADGKSVEVIGRGLYLRFPSGEGNTVERLTDDGEQPVTVSAVDDKKAYAVIKTPGTYAVCAEKSAFSDVSQSDWFIEDVDFAFGHGLFDGIAPDVFAPQGKMTRAMLATVLWRIEYCPASTGAPFADVPANSWYADAVAWVESQKIVTGYGEGIFAPNDNLTREQLAVMLYRYAKYLKLAPNGTGSAEEFSDIKEVSQWALEAVNWAVGADILRGRGGRILDPKGEATRAEVSAVMSRFITLAATYDWDI